MDARRESEPTPMKNRTTVERKSERELVVTRTFNGPARIVFEAWTKPELFRRWWVPKSMGMSLRSCEMDVRVGGKYRLEFEPDGMAFFGTYLEVTPHSRLVWTNEEGGEGGPVTTVTFEEKRGKTLLVMHELYSSKEALDAAGTGAADAMVETFAQLDELLLTLGASVGVMTSPRPSRRRARATACRLLGGRAPDAVSSRSLGAVRAKLELHAVTLAQHIDTLAVDGALMKEILRPVRALDETEALVRSQCLDHTCHALPSLSRTSISS